MKEFESMKNDYAKNGFLLDNIVSQVEVDELVKTINELYESGQLLEIKKKNRFGEYNFQTLNGDELLNKIPSVDDVQDRVLSYIHENLEFSHYVKLDNSQVGVSLNRYPSTGGTFRRHFDSHEMTCVVMLQPSSSGGELELFPESKIKVNVDVFSSSKLVFIQKLFDKFSHSWLARKFIHKKVQLQASAGQGVFFHGGYGIHSVTPVFGNTPRIVLVFGFDLPHRSFLQRKEYYGYGTGQFK